MHLNGKIGSFEKLKKTSAMMDESITNMFLQVYGIDGIRFANMEQVYSPIVSGMGSMAKVREHLIERGMTANFADLLAARYIKKQEEGASIFTLMDFFDTNKDGFRAMRLLAETDLSAISLNYNTLSSYSNSIMKKEYHQALFATRMKTSSQLPIAPIRPMAVTPRRLFSVDPKEERSQGRFFDFLRGASTKQEVEESQEQKEPEVVQEAKPEEPVKSEEVKVATATAEPTVAPEQVAEAQTPVPAVAPEPKKLTPQELKEQERMELMKKATRKYNIDFFKQYSFSGPDALKLSQKGLE